MKNGGYLGTTGAVSIIANEFFSFRCFLEFAVVFVFLSIQIVLEFLLHVRFPN